MKMIDGILIQLFLNARSYTQTVLVLRSSLNEASETIGLFVLRRFK
tara:strand:- start:4607 stop:4744 length:138 start_codon:yes stop_codon:yes gene_type:complete